jgi:uncharacterized membrane protein YedE/YeeE
MFVDWAAFTPTPALAGGFAIGAATALFVLANGRIAGISGIVGGLLHPVRGDRLWRIAFVAGLLAAAASYRVADVTVPIRIDAGSVRIVLAGLLVGVGTRLGAGCTSGHGVCGVARLSSRSIVATLLFIAAGCAAVLATRHVLLSF